MYYSFLCPKCLFQNVVTNGGSITSKQIYQRIVKMCLIDWFQQQYEANKIYVTEKNQRLKNMLKVKKIAVSDKAVLC